MKKILIVFSIIFHLSSNVYAQEFKLEKIVDGLDEPWSLSFIDDENILFTEKPGKLYLLNLKNKKISEIKHDLNFLEYGQGGLLDVLFSNQLISVPCSQLIVCWELDFIRVLWKLPRTTKFLLFGTWAHFAKFRKNSLNLCFIYCRFISSIQNMGAGSIFTVINQY